MAYLILSSYIFTFVCLSSSSLPLTNYKILLPFIFSHPLQVSVPYKPLTLSSFTINPSVPFSSVDNFRLSELWIHHTHFSNSQLLTSKSPFISSVNLQCFRHVLANVFCGSFTDICVCHPSQSVTP
jgi:hypothetical protein